MSNEALVARAEAAQAAAQRAAAQAAADRQAVEELVNTINTEQLPALEASKEDIRTAIIEKGQECDTTVPLDEYADKIRAIESGGVDTSSADITPQDVRIGKKGWGSDGEVVGTLAEVSAYRGLANQVVVPAGIHTEQTVDVGTVYTGATTITPGTSAVVIDSDTFLTDGLTIEAVSPGEDIDLSFVTATADDILSGKVSVNSAGEQITGNIETSIPTVSANVFSVAKGYVGENTELTVPEATVTETETQATVSPGYVANQLTFELGATEEVSIGYITADGKFQAMDNDVTPPTASGDAVDATLVSFKLPDGIEEPEISGGGAAVDFYKCAAVDTTTKTWSGYKAIFNGGVYSFEETLTEGLLFTDILPTVGSIYTADALLCLSESTSRTYVYSITACSNEDAIGDYYELSTGRAITTDSATSSLKLTKNNTVFKHDTKDYYMVYSSDSWYYSLMSITDFREGVLEGTSITSITQSDPTKLAGTYSGTTIEKFYTPQQEPVFYASLAEAKTRAETGQTMSVNQGTAVYETIDGIPALKCDGSFLMCCDDASALPWAATPRTFSVWVRPASGTAGSYPFSYGENAANKFFGLWADSTGWMRFAANNNSSAIQCPYTADTWVHVIGIYDGEQLHFYKNGTLYQSAAFPTPILATDSQNGTVNFGARQDFQYRFTGHIAACRIYNRVLSAEEIAELANEFTPTA